MVREFTQARLKGKKALRRSDFQQVACNLQALNPLYREKVTEILQNSGKGGVYYIANGVLFFKDQVIVPAQSALRKELLEAYYNNPRARHKGAGQTLKLLNQNFYWVGIRNNI